MINTEDIKTWVTVNGKRKPILKDSAKSSSSSGGKATSTQKKDIKFDELDRTKKKKEKKNKK